MLRYSYKSKERTKTMNNKNFLNQIDKKTKTEILKAIATHYGINENEAYEEVTHEEAESLLDYLTGSIRLATSVLMQKYGYR